MFKRRYRKNPILIRELPKRNHFITYIKSKNCFPIYRFTDKRNIKGQTLNVYKKRKVNYRLKYKAKRYLRRNLYIVNRYHNRPYKRRFYRIKRILRKISKKRKAKKFLRATFWRKASNYLIRLKQRVKRIIQRTIDYVVKRRLKRNYHMKSYLNKFLRFLSFLFVINSSQQILLNNRLRFNESKSFLIGKKFLYRKIISIQNIN